MSQCPACGNQLSSDAFGMTNCPSCKTWLRVAMDGTATIAKEEEEKNERAHEELAAPAEEINYESAPPPAPESLPQFDLPLADIPQTDLGTEQNFYQAPTENQFESPQQVHNDATVLPLPTDEDLTVVREPETYQENTVRRTPESPTRFELQGFDAFSNEATPSPQDVFKEISNFAKAPLQPSLLTYTLVISGLESASTQEELFTALQARKLDWNIDAIKSAIIDGQVRLENLNPAQAIFLVKSIHHLPLTISWRQNDVQI